MVVVTVPNSGPVLAEQAAPPASDAAALRRAFNVKAGDFKVVLVGKDGAEKHRTGGIVDPSHLLGLVDGVPLQQRDKGS